MQGSVYVDTNEFNSNNINLVSKELRKDALSIKNRLQSILYDAYFIESLVDKDILRYPLIPNERCGLWYVPNKLQLDSCYFKSTDGHTGQWSFNLRRLNLHLLPIISSYGGVCIIDSTRKGKKIPDALSKTIPIWCAVLNYIKFGNRENRDDILGVDDNWLRTPSTTISKSEHSQISDRIPKFAEQVVKLGIITPEKLSGLSKPLIPSWHYPGSASKETVDEERYFAVQCVTASKATNSAGGTQISIPGNSWYYVQGSADDHELWATSKICEGKLGPKFFWDHVVTSDELIDDYGFINNGISEDQLIERINEKYDREKAAVKSIQLDVTSVKNKTNDTNILFGKIQSDISYEELENSSAEIVVVLSDKWKVTGIPEDKKVQILEYKIESSKKGSKQLRDVLPGLFSHFDDKHGDKKSLILCDTGADLSVAIVLILLCKRFDLDWSRKDVASKIDKTLVKQQLSLLSEVRKINPSRNTLQSVNSFIMR